MKSTILTFLTIFFSLTGSSQHWATVKTDKDANFFEKQAAFEAHWAGKEYEKGKGYKQFKRWEWFWEQRVGEDGVLPSPTYLFEENQRYTEAERNSGPSRTNANWTPLGPSDISAQASGPGHGRVNCVVEDPTNSSILYVGTPAGGLWKSVNAGSSWTPMTDHLPSLGVSGVVVDYTNPDIVYIATGDGDHDDTYGIGVLKSYDGGVTWEATSLAWQIQAMRVCKRMIMSPVDNQILFVATDAGLYRTLNGGVDWSLVQGGDMDDVEFHPTNPDIVYACSAAVYKSVDGGDSFDSIQSEGLPASSSIERMSIAVSADEPDWLYVLAARADNYGFLGLFRSTNSGQSFTERSDSPNVMGWSYDGNDQGGQSWYDMALVADPADATTILVGGVNVWRSTNSGTSWTIKAHQWNSGFSGQYVHADIHSLDYYGNRLYCGSDGGIFLSTNDGNTFSDLTQGLQHTQYYRLGVSQSDPDLMLTGAQDNGTHRLNNGSWAKIYGGDGMECLVHPTNSSTYFVSWQNGNILRTTNGGNNFSNWVDGIPETGAWVTPFMLDPNDPNTLFVGFESIWKRSGSGSWQQVSESGGNITDFAIAPSNSDVIYLTRTSSVKRTTDGGDTWTTVQFGPSNVDKTDFTFNPDNEDEVYATISGFNEGEKVYRTMDGGDTWENISGSLPDFPANAIIYEEGSNGGVYLGMDVGIYYTNNDLANWIPYAEGLPNVVISELEIHESTGKLRAATFGRGAWESDLFTGIDVLPTADFSASDLSICEGEQITFTDLSLYHESTWDWSFAGAEPSTSDEAQPTVTYPNQGNYEVSLSVLNELGNDSETKPAYIHVIPASGEELPFSEDFQSFNSIDDTDRWFIQNNDQDVTWEHNDQYGFNSESCVWLQNSNNTIDNKDRLYSSTIDLSGVDEVLLTMDVAFAQKDEDNKDKLRVYVSSNCGANWSLKKTFSGHTTLSSMEPQVAEFFPNSDSDWHSLEVNNIGGSFLVDGFRMQLYFECDGGNNVFVDNINLFSTAVGLNDIDYNNLNLSLVPNPTSSHSELRFFLLGDRHVSYEIMDMTGRIVERADMGKLDFGQHSTRLDSKDWSPGIYVVSIDVDGHSQQVRWIVR